MLCWFISYTKKIKCIVKQVLLVFLGGGLGSAFRYLISNIPFLNIIKFPFQTFLSNIIGCLIFGIFICGLGD